jgi:hypothetical protein
MNTWKYPFEKGFSKPFPKLFASKLAFCKTAPYPRHPSPEIPHPANAKWLLSDYAKILMKAGGRES